MYSAYGLQKNDSMSRYELQEESNGQINFLESDDCGNLYVKQEMSACDKCGVSLRERLYTSTLKSSTARIAK